MSEQKTALAKIAEATYRRSQNMKGFPWEEVASAVEAEVLRRLRDGAGELERRLREKGIGFGSSSVYGKAFTDAADALAAYRAEKPSPPCSSERLFDAVSRIKAWLRDYGKDKTEVFRDDLGILVATGEAALKENPSPHPVHRTNAEIATKLRDLVKAVPDVFHGILTDAAERVGNMPESVRKTAGERMFDELERRIVLLAGKTWQRDIGQDTKAGFEAAAASLGITETTT